MPILPNDPRRQLFRLWRRIERQLQELSAIRVELNELNADPFSRPVAPDDYPGILGIRTKVRELQKLLSQIDRLAE